jgi:uridine kinase
MNNITSRKTIKISEVNNATRLDMSRFFLECNKSYEDKIKGIVKRIKKDTHYSKVIMMSGPSSSAKTTTSLKMKSELKELGIDAITISMDDFFKKQEDTPLLPDGSRDFESLQAIDLGLLKTTISNLIYKGSADLPIFSFRGGGRSTKTRHVEFKNDNVAIVEGLHALDTHVTDLIPQENILKLYVSVSSDFVDDVGNVLLSARDIRLIRRTIRDYKFRSSSPEHTFEMWDSVCRGEDMYIRPFKKNADIALNSVFKCEPCIYLPIAKELLSSIDQSSLHFEKADGIIKALSKFEEMPEQIVPGTCVLREFLGESIYYI